MVLGVLGAIFTFFGVLILIRSVKQYRLCMNSDDWPSVTGTINEAKVGTIQTRGNPMYLPVVNYTYTVADQVYEGQRIAVGDDKWTAWWLPSKEQAENKLQMYHANQPITVYYDPENHTEAALELGVSQGVWSALISGSLITILGIAALIMTAIFFL